MVVPSSSRRCVSERRSPAWAFGLLSAAIATALACGPAVAGAQLDSPPLPGRRLADPELERRIAAARAERDAGWALGASGVAGIGAAIALGVLGTHRWEESSCLDPRWYLPGSFCEEAIRRYVEHDVGLVSVAVVTGVCAGIGLFTALALVVSGEGRARGIDRERDLRRGPHVAIAGGPAGAAVGAAWEW